MHDFHRHLDGEPSKSWSSRMPTYKRLLSNNEASYFLPSRADGVNDICQNLRLRTHAHVVTSRRVAIAWAITRLQHPLLSAKVIMKPGAYNEVYFSYTPPSNEEQAISEAAENFEMRSYITADAIFDAFTNDPRTLSDKRLSYLIISPHGSDTASLREYDFSFSITHFLSDGIGFNTMINGFFAILGGVVNPGGRVRNEADLLEMLKAEWKKRWADVPPIGTDVMPTATEARLGHARNKFQEAAWKVDFKSSQDRFVGGQEFPRVRSKARQVAHATIILDTSKTDVILARCKSRGVTVNNALYTVCNFAWIRTMGRHLNASDMRRFEAIPTMLYTAISLRSHLPEPSPDESCIFLSLAYFNVVLPSFISSGMSPASVFWHRSRLVKEQLRRYSSSPMLVARSLLMSKERGQRARVFAKEDDDEALQLAQSDNPTTSKDLALQHAVTVKPAMASVKGIGLPAGAPSIALFGISQVGNLDDVYKAEMYPAIELDECQVATRKRKGGMLLFTHTFRGKLHLIFSWDRAAFAEGVVEEFWSDVGRCVNEFLVGERPTLSKL